MEYQNKMQSLDSETHYTHTLEHWLSLFSSMSLQTAVTRPSVLSLVARPEADISTNNDMKQ